MTHAHVRLKGAALAVGSLFVAALFTWSAAFCNRHSADSLLPTLISTQKLAWYYWGQNRLGNLLPLLTSPISDVDVNLRTQVFLRALCAVLGPMFFVLVARPCAPVLVVYAGVLMALLLVATPNLNFLFSYAVDGQPYGTSLAVMVAAVPMVMQVPAERAMPASISFHCCSVMLPASFSAQYFQTSEPEPRILPPKCPRIIGPAGM